MTKLSDMLVYLRKRSGLSQQQLADALEMTRSAISMYETGKREPGLEVLEAFADHYNVDMNTLTGGEDTPQTASLTSIEPIQNPDIRMIARAGKKMTPEQAETLRKYAQFMYPEAFEDDK